MGKGRNFAVTKGCKRMGEEENLQKFLKKCKRLERFSGSKFSISWIDELTALCYVTPQNSLQVLRRLHNLPQHFQDLRLKLADVA